MPNFIAQLKIALNDSIYSVPIYSILDYPDAQLRVMTNNGIGCLLLGEANENTPLRIMTPNGMKGFISTLEEPKPKLIREQLLSYYNVKRGVNGTVWSNIAPGRIQNASLKKMTVGENGAYTNLTYGSNVEMFIPPELMGSVSPFTMEIRFSATAFSSNLLTGYTDAKPSIYSYLSVTASRVNFTFTREDESATISDTFNVPISANNFYTYSFVYDGSNVIKLYMNGQFIASKEIGRVILNGATRLVLGESTRSVNTFKFIRLYKKELSQEEISINHEIGDEIGL